MQLRSDSSRLLVQSSLVVCLFGTGVYCRVTAYQQIIPIEIRTLHVLLYGAYPSLAAGLAARTARLDVNFGRNEAEAVAVDAPIGRIGQTVLFATIKIDTDGAIRSYVGAGPIARSDDNEHLRDVLDRHHEWTSVDAVRWLVSSGARATQDTFRSMISGPHAAKWLSLLGSNVHLDSVWFGWHPLRNGTPTKPTYDEPLWIVEVHAIRHSAAVAYELRFEPFDGALVGILRH